MDAIIFMPDYLLEEAISDLGGQQMEDNQEFQPA